MLAGLVIVASGRNLAGSGPRATAKIVRWSRVQVGELAVETEGPHRMISFQVESIGPRGAPTSRRRDRPLRARACYAADRGPSVAVLRRRRPAADGAGSRPGPPAKRAPGPAVEAAAPPARTATSSQTTVRRGARERGRRPGSQA